VFSIRKGSTRSVLMVGNLFVLKFPRKGRRLFLRGVIANLSEYFVYKFSHASYLVPCFSIGIVTVQKYEHGEIPTNIEIWNRLNVSEKATRILQSVAPHEFMGKNWRKNSKGYRMIDYGYNMYSGTYPISDFLSQFKRELTESLSKTETKVV
jgi:hypothetical protein